MKNIYRYPIILGALHLLISISACEDYLEEQVFTQFAPEGLLQTEAGIERVLIGAYDELQTNAFDGRDIYITLNEFTTDIAIQSGGGFERTAVLFLDFQWDPALGTFSTIWGKFYRAVRNANSLLDNIDQVTSLSDEKLKQLRAEAVFIRASAYDYLYDFFGPVPLITTAASLDFEVSKPTKQEFVDFMVTELRKAADGLPITQELYGRATKGAALALLCKFYLNNKDWQLSADVAQEIINLNQYGLFPEIENLFSVDNENNTEYIYVHPAVAQIGEGHVYVPHAFPLGYPLLPNWENFAAQFRTPTSFVESFHPDDRRLRMFLTEYTDVNGNFHEMVRDGEGAPLDDARSLKYTPDPNSNARWNGNDQPVIRYAEILLNRAEALNEINGPNQESIDLINMVRSRAGVPVILLSDYPVKESLRDHILAERGWEFFTEGKRRPDLIRHGKFISEAVARGKNAQTHHQVFPIPLREIDSNPKLVQNDGYNQ